MWANYRSCLVSIARIAIFQPSTRNFLLNSCSTLNFFFGQPHQRSRCDKVYISYHWISQKPFIFLQLFFRSISERCSVSAAMGFQLVPRYRQSSRVTKFLQYSNHPSRRIGLQIGSKPRFAEIVTPTRLSNVVLVDDQNVKKPLKYGNVIPRFTNDMRHRGILINVR